VAAESCGPPPVPSSRARRRASSRLSSSSNRSRKTRRTVATWSGAAFSISRRPSSVAETKRPASVLGAARAPDESACGHAGHLVRDAAALPHQRVGERGHAKRAVGLAEMNQHLELGLGQSRCGLEVALDLQVEAALEREEGAPEGCFLGIEPPHLFGHALILASS